jgi:hypothetical protein
MENNSEQPVYRTIDKYDRMMGSLVDLPDVSKTKPSTLVVQLPFLGAVGTYIVQTLRQRERGDTVFVTYVDDRGSVRLFLPPAVADAIARQRESLTTQVRKRLGKEQAQARKARGEKPAFLRNKKTKETKDG